MNNVQERIASDFSVGQFKVAFDHMANDVFWDVKGEAIFVGKKAVVEQCGKVLKYFNTVETNFVIHQIISSTNGVVVTGKATFRKAENLLAVISACDVYKFDDTDKLLQITSYCIKEPISS